MWGIKVVGWVILVGMLGHITELKRHAVEKDSFAMLVDLGYTLSFGFVGLSMLLS